MLARKFRLTGKENFERVQRDGQVYQSQNFGVAFVPRGDDAPSRFAFIVSTKISKSAVDRNLFKRTMNEAVRLSGHDIKNGFDIALLAKPSIMRTPTDILMKEVKNALIESGILK